MRGIPLDMSNVKAKIDFSKEISGFDATTQNLLVNIGQKQGSDIIFEGKGNSIHDQAVASALPTPELLSVALHDMTASLVAFSRDTEVESNEDELNYVELDVEQFSGDYAKISVLATSVSGETKGMEARI